MGRRSKQIMHLRLLSESKIVCLQITHIVRYVLSVARFGLSEQQARMFLLSNDITPPTKSQFYACQQTLIPKLEELARLNCSQYMTHNEDAFYLRYDGSWSSRRNATHCLVELINDNGKIVDFDILSRIPCTKYRVCTGYFGPSNRMEDILIEQLAERWKDNPKLKGFAHDGDLTSAKFWLTPNQENSPLVELHDPGHAKSH